jgi:diguanylate cyclase (GGDEF)-like protein
MMANVEKYLVPVTPELQAGTADRWVGSINVLLKAGLLHGLHLDTEAALKIMVDLAGEMVPFEKALFYLMDEETRTFNLQVTRGFDQPIPPSFHHGNPLVGWTVDKHRPLRVTASDVPELSKMEDVTGCPAVLSIPVQMTSEVRGVLQLFSPDPEAFPDETVRLLWILALQMGGVLVRLQHEPGAGTAADQDPFTGLMKRPVFEKELLRELSRSRRSDRPFCFLLVGIDGYERVVQGLTTLEIDLLIHEIAAILRKAGRKMDLMARHADPVISVLLSEADEARASLFASRVMRMVSAANLGSVSGRPFSRASVSIGIASFPRFVTSADLAAAAERALAAARKEGESQVVLASTLAGGADYDPVSFDLRELLGSVTSHFRLKGLIESLTEFYSRALGAERVSIQVFDPSDSSLQFLHGKGFQGFENDIREARTTLERSISGKSLLSRRPLVVEDIDNSLPDRPRRRMRYKGGSFMTIPLFHHGAPVGVINFSNRKGGGAFTGRDLENISRHTPLLAEFLAVGRRFEEIQDSFFRKTAEILLGVAESKTPYMVGHGERVARLTSQLAAGLGIAPEEAVRLTDSARFHDLGRIAVDEAVLSKIEPLEEREREQIRQHPDWSSRILEALPGLHLDGEAIRTHHERPDGKGYPGGLMGEEIPLGGRVLAVADAYDAMTHARPYRKALDQSEALLLLEAGKGKQWDARVVKAFRAVALAN